MIGRPGRLREVPGGYGRFREVLGGPENSRMLREVPGGQEGPGDLGCSGRPRRFQEAREV